MSIVILINESQKNKILIENVSKKLGDSIEREYSFAKNILKKAETQTGIDFKFLFTWGAGIGGFFQPVSDFVEGKFPELSSLNVSLIVTAIICTYYVDNKDILLKIFEKIKSENLLTQFKISLEKSDELKTTFINFLGGLGVTIHKVINMLSYTFIIPILEILLNIATSGSLNEKQITEIGIRLASYGFITASSSTIETLVKTIFKKFSDK
jgi:hypothetical protein